MNIWTEIVFALIRCASIITGTFLVIRGPVFAGAVLIAAALLHSVWSKIYVAAAARLALMFPSGSPAWFVISAMKQVTVSSWWFFAKDLARQTSDGERHRHEQAIEAVRTTLAAHGFGEPPPAGGTT